METVSEHMVHFIIFIFLASIVFEVLFNFMVPKDPNKYTIVDYFNMLNRDKTRNMVGKITNPFNRFNFHD